MSEWKEYKLGDFIKVKHGYAFPGEHITSIETDKILVTPGNFHIGGGFKSDKFKYYNSNDFPQEYMLHGGDIIVTMTDLSKDTDTLGYSAKVPNNISKLYLHNQRIGLLQFRSDKVYPDFVYWLMRTKEYQSYIVGSASGTSIMHTSPSRIEAYSFLFPPIEEQKRIAGVLSSLDDKIDLLHRENATLEALAETLFRHYFIENPNPEWKEGKLGYVAKIGIGRTPPRKETKWFSSSPMDVKWISIKDMGEQGVFIFNTAESLTKDAVEKFKIPIIPPNTVVLSFKMTVGRIGITTETMLSNEAIAHFLLDDDSPITKEYLYLYLKSYKFDTLGSTSSIVTSINSAMIKDIEIVIPDKETMNIFKAQVMPLFEKVKSNQQQIQTLSSQRDTLLPRLMSGDVNATKYI